MQLLKIESAGTAAEKALLADVKAKNADATATELLRLFKVRCSPTRSAGICGMVQRTCCTIYALRRVSS